jgi:hypothetical protein
MSFFSHVSPIKMIFIVLHYNIFSFNLTLKFAFMCHDKIAIRFFNVVCGVVTPHIYPKWT